MRLTAPPGLLGRRAVKTSTPSSVTSSVCSNCADHEPSRVDDVQLSGHVWSRNGAQRQHRLNSKRHAGLGNAGCLVMGIMRDVRRAVEVLVDSVAAVCAHNAELVGLGVLFNHIAKAAEKNTGLDGGDRLVKGLTGSLNQAHHIRVGLGLITNVVCLIEIRVQAIAVDGNVEVDDITVLKRALVRDTVANDLVNAGADTLGEVVVVEWRRVGVALHAFLVDDGVNLLGGHTGLDSGSASVKHLTRVPVKLAELDEWSRGP